MFSLRGVCREHGVPCSTTSRLARHCLAGICVLPAGGLAGEAVPWPPVVPETIAETCATRGLALHRPLAVRPMSAFEGGYTAGVGSVVWEAEDARTWREGWCALGVYCAAAPAAAGKAGGGSSPLAGPRGLYDHERATLFVAADGGAVPAAAIAHETTHALQHQNYPQLAAIHLWHNRDLAAAANAALEGDAHLVGAAFDPLWRLSLCSMNPRHATANLQRLWRWRADNFWAHEGFPHVFGPGLALRRQLAGGNAGANELVQAPPLATRTVLAPDASDGVAFIDLSVDVDAKGLAERSCQPGLANTAGAVGIWGLLLQHGAEDVAATAMPDFLEAWLGDRFVHLACDGDQGDELAWLTQWRSAEAAQAFLQRYRQVAAVATAHGKVLNTTPTAARRGEQVLVATAGLRQQRAALFDAPRKVFHSYGEWTAANCYPQAQCEPAPPVAEAGATQTCDDATPSSRLADWIGRIRDARAQYRLPTPAEQTELANQAAELATFCIRNSLRNSDLALACRAVVTGIRHWQGWQADTSWQLLPHCATPAELKEWLRSGYHADVLRPLAATESFASLYGAPFAAAAFAGGGMAGLRQLLANPPLSTAPLLGLPPTEIGFARLPEAALAEAGCTVSADDVRGPFAIWTLLLDYGGGFAADAPPPLLAHWRGDRQFYLRCGDDAGWVWASRWQSRGAARQFAAHYADLDATVAETGLPPGPPRRRGRMVLAAPSAWSSKAARIADALTWETSRDWRDWTAAGCLPQKACRGTVPRAAHE